MHFSIYRGLFHWRDNEVVTKLTHVAAPPCVPVIRSGRYVDSALFVQAEVKADDWNASWRHQTNGALSDNPIVEQLCKHFNLEFTTTLQYIYGNTICSWSPVALEPLNS